jgi:hypothetical protein
MVSEEMHIDLTVTWSSTLSNFNQTLCQHTLAKFLKPHISHKSAQQFSTCYTQTHKPTDRKYKVNMQLSTANAPKEETEKKCETKQKSWQH